MAEILIAGVALAVFAVLGGVLLSARAQLQRLTARVDVLANRLTAYSGVPTEQSRLLDAQAGEQPPNFVLAELGGERQALADLLASGKPLVLVFVDPRCGPCYEVLPDVGDWQRAHRDRLSLALVSRGEPRTNQAMTAEYGIRLVLLQDEREVADAFGLAQLPAAVVIQPDGRVGAGPRYGAEAIRQLVADMLGLALPTKAPSREIQVAGIGQAAPRIRRPDLDGKAIEVGGRGREPTLLLFWRPGCQHCQVLLPEIKAWEELTAGGPRLLIVSRGPVALNKEAGFTSPVVLDDDQAIATAFGVGGTPAVVAIDAAGVVAVTARGATEVRALVPHLLVSPSIAAD